MKNANFQNLKCFKKIQNFDFPLTFPRDFFDFEKIVFEILKILFRHEKMIFFAQDFFPGKIRLGTRDFCPLRTSGSS